MENKYQRLGTRTFWVFVFESLAPAIVTSLIWLGLLIIEVVGLSTLFPFLSTNQASLDSADKVLTLGIVAGIPLIFLFVFLAFIIALVRYFGYAYSLDENSFRVSLGILNKFDISIPYRQIQDINLERTLINRLWGVSRLSILTAGTEDTTADGREVSSGDIPVLEKGKADFLREELLKRANIQKTTTT